jgi:hypothetical protein
MNLNLFFKLQKIVIPKPKNNPLIKNFKGFIRLYENTKYSHIHEDYISGAIMRRYSHLKFRADGDVDYDERSKNPRFVSYNNVRLEIKESLIRGEHFFTWNFSNMVWESLVADGYRPHLLKEVNEKGHRHGLYLTIER